jgi:hypothetical protein
MSESALTGHADRLTSPFVTLMMRHGRPDRRITTPDPARVRALSIRPLVAEDHAHVACRRIGR